MVRTRVGYTGGSKKSPTYSSLGNHTEALQVDLDPDVIGYRDLLEEIFKQHNPLRNVAQSQYRHAIWFHDHEQQEILTSYIEDTDDVPDGSGLETDIEPLGTFYRAEEYHQKYYLRKHSSYMEFFEDYTPEEFRNSTTAARLNGILAGKGSSPEVLDDLTGLELSPPLQRDLRTRIG